MAFKAEMFQLVATTTLFGFDNHYVDW